MASSPPPQSELARVFSPPPQSVTVSVDTTYETPRSPKFDPNKEIDAEARDPRFTALRVKTESDHDLSPREADSPLRKPLPGEQKYDREDDTKW